jgi:hypothetical protein
MTASCQRLWGVKCPTVVQGVCLEVQGDVYGLPGRVMVASVYQCFLFSSGFADSRKKWGFGLALERILAW